MTLRICCGVLQERGVSQLVGRTKFVEPDDSLVLEDASARMAVLGTVLSPADVVTGVVLALRGMANASGQFLTTVCMRLCHCQPYFFVNYRLVIFRWRVGGQQSPAPHCVCPCLCECAWPP